VSGAGWPLPTRPNAILFALGGAFLLVMVSIVIGALSRPDTPAFEITTPRPMVFGDTLAGPIQVTLDATSEHDWRFFRFSRGSVVEHPGPLDWDLAVRRFHVVTNGGPGFAGQGGLQDLGAVPFDSVREVPESGYASTAPDTTNPAVGKWYGYSWTSHLLRPKGNVYALRTAEGKYAVLEIVSYYCPGARAGCVTIRYAYQGDGSRRMR